MVLSSSGLKGAFRTALSMIKRLKSRLIQGSRLMRFEYWPAAREYEVFDLVSQAVPTGVALRDRRTWLSFHLCKAPDVSRGKELRYSRLTCSALRWCVPNYEQLSSVRTH